MNKTGRNDLCPCGSSKKYKLCCLNKAIIIRESWNEIDYNFLNLFPMKKICNILGRDPLLKVYDNAFIKVDNLLTYNTVIAVRAHNEGMKEYLYKYFNDIARSDFEELFNIYLPQVLISDSLGFENPIISLHITKLNKYEIFINDIILYRDPQNRLLNGVFDDVLNNLKEFGKLEGVKYISGHASLRPQYEKFLSKGFKKDVRKEMGNDFLWAQIKKTYVEVELPFYMEI